MGAAEVGQGGRAEADGETGVDPVSTQREPNRTMGQS